MHNERIGRHPHFICVTDLRLRIHGEHHGEEGGRLSLGVALGARRKEEGRGGGRRCRRRRGGAIQRARYAAESGEQSAAGVQRDREGRVIRNRTVVVRSPVVAQSSPKRPLT